MKEPITVREYARLTTDDVESSLDLAKGALIGAQAAGRPVWLSVSVDDRDGTRLRSGEPVAGLADVLKAAPAAAVLANCSMPEAMVNRYLIDVSRTGEQRIVPVLFGLPQGLAGKRLNADYFSRMMQASLECRDTPKSPCQRLAVSLKVNPVLFTRYNISEAPALVYDNGQDSWSIQGETELAFLLEKMSKAANSPALAGLSARLRGGQ